MFYRYLRAPQRFLSNLQQKLFSYIMVITALDTIHNLAYYYSKDIIQSLAFSVLVRSFRGSSEHIEETELAALLSLQQMYYSF